MLRVVNLEEIQNLLLQVPGIVELGDKGEFGFVSSVKNWLTHMEIVLKSNKLSVSANVAALRGYLVSSEKGVIPADISFVGRVSKRKVREATASHSISSAVEIVSEKISKDIERVEEANRVLRQLVCIAKRSGVVFDLPSDKNFGEALKSIWSKMSKDQVLAQGVVSVEGLVGPHDALILLDRTITADKEKGASK